MTRDTAPLDLDTLAPVAAAGIRILPVVHERLEMTAVVRAVLDQLEPAGVALELPTTLAETVNRAVRRLPRISLIVSEEQGEDALVWVVVPGDPFVEALRSFDYGGHHLDVRENVKFRGGAFPAWTHRTFPDSACVLSIEFKKFFMDEWTGEPDEVLVSAIGSALNTTLPGALVELARL